MRYTSIEAYNKIKENGLLGRLQFKVYEHVFKNKPITQKKTCVSFGMRDERSITPRFAELRRYGVLRTCGEIACEYTGFTVDLWETTNELPVKTKQETNKAKIKRLSIALEEISQTTTDMFSKQIADEALENG